MKLIKRLLILIFFLIVIWWILQGLLSNNYILKIFYPYPYQEIIEEYAYEYGVDPLLVVAVIREESHFRTTSSSGKGAIGLMQLMPDTAKEISVWLKEDFTQVDLHDPEVNIRYGTWYLASLKKQFSNNIILVLASYNAGGGRVAKWLESKQLDLNNYIIEDIPYEETREYVKKVTKSYRIYTKLYATL